jgi:hypothetical protein
MSAKSVAGAKASFRGKSEETDLLMWYLILDGWSVIGDLRFGRRVAGRGAGCALRVEIFCGVGTMYELRNNRPALFLDTSWIVSRFELDARIRPNL